MLILYPISQKSQDCMSKNMLKNLECIYYFIINTLTKLGTEGCSKNFSNFYSLKFISSEFVNGRVKAFHSTWKEFKHLGKWICCNKVQNWNGYSKRECSIILKSYGQTFWKKRLSFRIASSTLQPLSFEKIWTWSDNLSSLNKTTSSLGMWASNL